MKRCTAGVCMKEQPDDAFGQNKHACKQCLVVLGGIVVMLIVGCAIERAVRRSRR